MEFRKKATINSGGGGGSSSSSGGGVGVGGGGGSGSSSSISGRNSSTSSDLENKMLWEKVRHIFKHYLKRNRLGCLGPNYFRSMTKITVIVITF